MDEGVQEADSESAEDEDDDPLPDYEDDEEDPFGCNGAANPADGPASRKVKPREKGDDDDDDDDDDDIEVFTGAGNTTPSSAFLAGRHGQDTAMADTKANKGVIAPISKPASTPKPASSEDAFDFLKDILRGPSETTMFAPGQNQDLMDALGAILFEPSTAKASQSKSASGSTSKKLIDSRDEDGLSDASLNVKQSKAAVRAAGNAFTTSSSTALPLAPMQNISRRPADFGFQKASKPKPPVSKFAKGKGKENLKDPTEVFDGMLSKLSKLKVLQGPPSRHILGPDGLPISTSKQKVVTKPQSILDAVPSKAFSLAPFKPAGGRVFKPVTNAALRPTSNDVLKHVGNAVQGGKDILAFGGATPASKALAAALDDLDTNMGDTPTPPPVGDNTAQPQALGCNPLLRPPALPTGLSSDVDQHMGAPNSQQAAGPSPQPMPSVDLEMGSDCDAQLPAALTAAEDHLMRDATVIPLPLQPMDLQAETPTNEVNDQTSRMEDIQTIPKAAVKPLGYIPPFFIVAPPVFVFRATRIGRRRTYSEAFSEEKQRYMPSKKPKHEIPSQREESDNANPSVASSSAASSVYVPPLIHTVTAATSVPNIGVPSNVQQVASVPEKVILGKRRNYEDAFSAKEEHSIPANPEGCVPPPETTTARRSHEEAFYTGHEDGSSSKKHKLDHEFSPELAFEIELEAMIRGFAELSIDYPAGASKPQKVVRKPTRYRAGGRRGAGGVVVVNGMAYKSPRDGPARQTIKNPRHFGCDKRVPPAIERALVIVVVNEPVPIAGAPRPIDRPLLPIIERGRRNLAELRAHTEDTHPPAPVKPLDELPRLARLAARHYATGPPSLPRNRSSTPEYDDAVGKLRHGAALSPPPPKKMEGELVEDEQSKVDVGRGLFAGLRRLFLGR